MTPTKQTTLTLSPRKLRSSSKWKACSASPVSSDSPTLVVDLRRMIIKTPVASGKKRVDKSLRKALSTSRKGDKENKKLSKKLPCSSGSRRQLTFETPTKCDTSTSVYCQALSSLSVSRPSSLLCREWSVRRVTAFLTQAFAPGCGRQRALYISGPPGTGKTACITHLLASECNSNLVLPNNVRVAMANCVTSSAGELLIRVRDALELHQEEACLNYDHLEKLLSKRFKKTDEKWILVLDEIDQIKDKSLLYKLFEWPYLKHSRIVLIGIANALDFTDRLLPRLKLKEGLDPCRLTFAPYTACEIDAILTSRLTSCRAQDLFRPEAIKFVSSKVASVSGDVRMALDVCKRALEQAHNKKEQRQILKETNDEDSEMLEVGLPDVARIFDAHFGSQLKRGVSADRQQSLPLQQQLLTVTLLLMDEETSMGKLHETYARLCSSKGLGACDLAEVISLCSLMENRGLVTTKKPNRQALARDTRVVLRVDAKEVEDCFKDKALFSNIVNNPQAFINPRK